jgi:hypothetical protein
MSNLATVTAAVLPDPMGDLIRRINEAHEEVRLTLKTTGQAAIKVGLLLLQAKQLAGHGSFADWICTHCNFSERTAQLYMQLARQFPNPQSFADLSLSDLMKKMAPLKLKEPTGESKQTVRKDKVTAAIEGSSAYDVLTRAWEKTTAVERKKFLLQVQAPPQT